MVALMRLELIVEQPLLSGLFEVQHHILQGNAELMRQNVIVLAMQIGLEFAHNVFQPFIRLCFGGLGGIFGKASFNRFSIFGFKGFGILANDAGLNEMRHVEILAHIVGKGGSGQEQLARCLEFLERGENFRISILGTIMGFINDCVKVEIQKDELGESGKS